MALFLLRSRPVTARALVSQWPRRTPWTAVRRITFRAAAGHLPPGFADAFTVNLQVTKQTLHQTSPDSPDDGMTDLQRQAVRRVQKWFCRLSAPPNTYDTLVLLMSLPLHHWLDEKDFLAHLLYATNVPRDRPIFLHAAVVDQVPLYDNHSGTLTASDGFSLLRTHRENVVTAADPGLAMEEQDEWKTEQRRRSIPPSTPPSLVFDIPPPASSSSSTTSSASAAAAAADMMDYTTLDLPLADTYVNALMPHKFYTSVWDPSAGRGISQLKLKPQWTRMQWLKGKTTLRLRGPGLGAAAADGGNSSSSTPVQPPPQGTGSNTNGNDTTGSDSSSSTTTSSSGSKSTITIPLLPLTPAHRIHRSAGNIISQLWPRNAAGPMPASEELEKLIPRLRELRLDATGDEETYYAGGGLGVWALTIPPSQAVAGSVGGPVGELPVLDIKEAAAAVAEWGRYQLLERELAEKVRGRLKELVARGCRLHRVVSGGGGWGAKRGLLSLDPETKFPVEDKEEKQRSTRSSSSSKDTEDDDFDYGVLANFMASLVGEAPPTTGNAGERGLAMPGMYIQFLVEPVEAFPSPLSSPSSSSSASPSSTKPSPPPTENPNATNTAKNTNNEPLTNAKTTTLTLALGVIPDPSTSSTTSSSSPFPPAHTTATAHAHNLLSTITHRAVSPVLCGQENLFGAVSSSAIYLSGWKKTAAANTRNLYGGGAGTRSARTSLLSWSAAVAGKDGGNKNNDKEIRVVDTKLDAPLTWVVARVEGAVRPGIPSAVWKRSKGEGEDFGEEDVEWRVVEIRQS
ncbi:hypothetical protein VTJ04DRAFT_3367 [Mycothermus thermophilus]|uniref:uncharacterized protein n=1 Tax=Humicola insolens TaxID=85995 RepID=UPI003743BCAB